MKKASQSFVENPAKGTSLLNQNSRQKSRAPVVEHDSAGNKNILLKRNNGGWPTLVQHGGGVPISTFSNKE